MSIRDITIADMLKLSRKLHTKHEHEWGPADPESGLRQFAWLITEIGEVLDILKKEGVERIMKNKKVRAHALEEIADCYMYLANILNRYHFTGKDFSKAYFDKMKYNFKRVYPYKSGAKG